MLAKQSLDKVFDYFDQSEVRWEERGSLKLFYILIIDKIINSLSIPQKEKAEIVADVGEIFHKIDSKLGEKLEEIHKNQVESITKKIIK